MADHVKEEIITKKHKAFGNVAYVLVWISMLFSAILGSFYLMSLMSGGLNVANVLMLLVFGGIAWLSWVGKDTLKTEYEYSFTNGVVDIAQVLNNRRRKELISFRSRECEVIAPIDDPRLDDYLKKPGIKKVKAVLNADSNVIFAITKKSDQVYLVYMEPSEEMVRYMRMYQERSVRR